MPKLTKSKVGSIEKKDQTLARPVVKNNKDRVKKYLRKAGLKRRTYIKNVSNKEAYIFISDTPVTHINQITVKDIMSMSLEHVGEYKIQEFRVMPRISRKVIVTAHNFYFTIFIFIDDKDDDGEWRLLCKNRQGCCSYDVNIVGRHIDEVMSPSFFQKKAKKNTLKDNNI